jgi:hypothetical protein
MRIFLSALAIAAAFITGSLVTAFGQADFDYLKLAGAPLLALVSAFAGAYFAFDFNRQKDADTQRMSNLAAGNRAIFTLGRQVNRIANIQRQLLDPHRGDPLRHLNMPPSVQERPLPSMDFDSIAFLLTTARPNLIGEIAVAEDAAFSAIDVINQRSRTHLTEFQPLIENAGIKPTKQYSARDVEEILGPRLWIVLKQATDQLYDASESAIEKLDRASHELHELLKSEFRGHRIVKITLPDNASPAAPEDASNKSG